MIIIRLYSEKFLNKRCSFERCQYLTLATEPKLEKRKHLPDLFLVNAVVIMVEGRSKTALHLIG